jgi:hypothetical protein
MHELLTFIMGQYLRGKIQTYFTDDFLTGLLMLMLVTHFGPLRDWIHIFLLLGIPSSETNVNEAMNRDPSFDGTQANI